MPVKAILLDYIGTLVEPRNYNLQDSKEKLHKALCEAGLVTKKEQFMKAYDRAHEKYRAVRYEQLKEVTNAVWVSEALNAINCKTTTGDPKLKAGLNVFFQEFIETLQLRPHAKQLIKNASEHCKIALVSNFTYAPAIYASLRKLRINKLFCAVVVSEAVGWRKPHRAIFEEALRRMQADVCDAVFVGDSPVEDIGGAKSFGLRTVFVASRFTTLVDLERSGVKPDLAVTDLAEVCQKLGKMFRLL